MSANLFPSDWSSINSKDTKFKSHDVIQLFEFDQYAEEVLKTLSSSTDIILSTDITILERKKEIIAWLAFILNNSVWNEQIEKDTDPKFTTKLRSYDIEVWLRNVFQKMNITTLWDLVKYKDIEDFTADYQKIFGVNSYERTNGSKLSQRTENKLQTFMKEKNISWGMSTKLSDKVAADQEKMKRLLSLSFDLSQLENRKAMKEFGIDNTSGVFTKLFDSGIKNFQDLLITYRSWDDIDIPSFGSRAQVVLSQYMENNNIFWDMDIS